MKLPQPKNPEKGFTLIELMIVIAIIAILVAIALPQLQTYLRKTAFTEVINAASTPKANLTALVQERDGGFPTAAESNTYDVASGYSKSIAILDVDSNGTDGTDGDELTVCTTGSAVDGTKLHSDLQGKIVMMTASVDGGTLSWACTSDAAQKYLPGTCSSVATLACDGT